MGIVMVGASNFTGGTDNDLDGYDGSSFAVGDAAMVHRPGYAPIFYEFISTTDAENSPYLIRPDTNGTGVAWRQCDLITGNCTLYVTTTGNDSTGNGTSSAPWATLGKAITWLSDKRTISGVNPTISIGAGTFAEAGVITIYGHVFRNVVISGAGSSSTTLSWAAAGTGGILIDRCTALENIKNIKLLGNGTSGNGLHVNANSSCAAASDLVVDSFSNGVWIDGSSSVDFSSALTSSNNGSHGFVAINHSNAEVSGCTFNNNTTHGVLSQESSNVYAASSTSTNNTTGYRSYRNSFVNASTCTVSGNTTDYSPAKTTANDPTFGNLGSWIYG